MEPRNIMLLKDVGASQTVVVSIAETLGEFKRELQALHIDTENMTFYEAISGVEFTGDSSQLPTTVIDREGNPTSSLIMMMTLSKNKICSGTSGTETHRHYRQLLYRKVKDLFTAHPEAKNAIDRPFTNLSNERLEELIREYSTNECLERPIREYSTEEFKSPMTTLPSTELLFSIREKMITINTITNDLIASIDQYFNMIEDGTLPPESMFSCEDLNYYVSKLHRGI